MLDFALLNTVLAEHLDRLGLAPEPRREKVRAWTHGGVERLVFADGLTLIHKYGHAPLAHEAATHRVLQAAGVPVATLHSSEVRDKHMTIVMEDLGEAERPATEDEVLALLLVLHRAPSPPGSPSLSESTMITLPDRARWHLDRLQETGRWTALAGRLGDDLDKVRKVSEERSAGADQEPFGWVHTEIAGNGVHVGPRGIRLIDFARSYAGPVLFDLVSWGDGLDRPRPREARAFLERYVDLGGPASTLDRRAGLSAERWALAWLRVWRVEWYLEQSAVRYADPGLDATRQALVRRNMDQALDLLEL
ncbi:phosphotransferase [Streptomyces sp. NPDC088923]|uniref:phosphotransferase n=1 Tax=Streptomyces sp. NPDC088923 TaxID=3365913 RepID=UPI0038173BFB